MCSSIALHKLIELFKEEGTFLWHHDEHITCQLVIHIFEVLCYQGSISIWLVLWIIPTYIHIYTYIYIYIYISVGTIIDYNR